MRTAAGHPADRVVRWCLPPAAVAGTAWASSDFGKDQWLLTLCLVVAAGAFSLTASFLLGDPYQRGNGYVFALVAVTFVLDRSTWLPIGRWATVGAFAGTFTPVLLSVILLRYPEATLDRPGKVFVATNGVIAFVIGLAVALSYPHWVGGPWEPSRQFLGLISLRRSWQAVGGLACVALIVRRYRRFGRLGRAVLNPVLAAGAVEALLIASFALQPWTPTSVLPVLTLARTVGATLIPLSLLLSSLLLLRSLAGVARLVAEMSGADTVDAVEAGLRRALRRPDLEVYYWIAQRGVLVGSSGARTDDLGSFPASHVIRIVAEHGGLLGVVLTRRGPIVQVQLRHSIEGVCRLAMASAHLEAELRAQLRETADARARLVSHALVERRRLERDVHDGAQQRLLGVGMLLAAAEKSASGELQDLVRRIKVELDESLVELRDLAHGIYPATLARLGLGAALEHVAVRLPLTVTMSVEDRRWAADVELTLYFVTCEALANACKHGAATRAYVRVASEDGRVLAEIGDDGRGSPQLNAERSLPDLRDRVEALGGTLTIRSGPDGTQLRAQVPSRDAQAD